MSIKSTQYITREEAIWHLAKKEVEAAKNAILNEYDGYTNDELSDMMDANPCSIFENYIVVDHLPDGQLLNY